MLSSVVLGVKAGSNGSGPLSAVSTTTPVGVLTLVHDNGRRLEAQGHWKEGQMDELYVYTTTRTALPASPLSEKVFCRTNRSRYRNNIGPTLIDERAAKSAVWKCGAGLASCVSLEIGAEGTARRVVRVSTKTRPGFAEHPLVVRGGRQPGQPEVAKGSSKCQAMTSQRAPL